MRKGNRGLPDDLEVPIDGGQLVACRHPPQIEHEGAQLLVELAAHLDGRHALQVRRGTGAERFRGRGIGHDRLQMRAPLVRATEEDRADTEAEARLEPQACVHLRVLHQRQVDLRGVRDLAVDHLLDVGLVEPIAGLVGLHRRSEHEDEQQAADDAHGGLP